MPAALRRRILRCSLLVLLAGGALVMARKAAAQTWAKVFGSAATDWITAAAAAPGGAAFVGGTTDQVGDTTKYDLWVAMVDATGTVRWHRRLGTNVHESLIGLEPAADGGVFLLAAIAPVTATVDTIVAKLSAGGLVEWQVQVRVADAEAPLAVKATADGGLIVSVFTELRARILLRLDATGTLAWQRALEGGPLFQVMDEHPDGGFVAAGRYFPVVEIYDRGWVARFDATGGRVWERAIEFGTEQTDVRLVGCTPDGAVLVAGYSGFPADQWDTLFTMRFDATGELAWQQSHLWPEATRLTGVTGAVLADGGFLVGGRGRNPTTLAEDGWYARFLPDGTLAWQGTYYRGDAIGGDIDAIAALSDGHWLAAGTSERVELGISDTVLIRMDDTGFISYPCPELQPGGMVPDPKTAVIVPVTTDDVALTATIEPANLTVTDETWSLVDHCCPYRDPPAELSGPGSGQPLRLYRPFTRMEWEYPPLSGSCAANLYRGDLRDLRAGGHGTCFQEFIDDGDWSDSSRPPAGSAWFYLVIAVTLVSEGSMGTDSFGAPRANATPCP
jgi:hypothetical protein